MDEGWIVLVNTQPKDQSDEAAALFTRLLVKQLFMTAKQRQKSAQNRPFFLVIDEASRYLTTDTARILAETAGYGLYLVLGMQSIEQARRENEETYIAIRACMNAEVVMRLTDFDEAIYFARRFYGHYLDLDTVQYEQTQTAAVPHTVPHVTLSRQRQTARTTGGSVGGSTVRTRATGIAALLAAVPASSTAESSNWVDVNTTTELDGETETPGWHTEFTYQELTAKQFYTPDQLERLAARRFALRPKGAGKRFGVTRINEIEPADIEIPSLSPARYSPREMAEWLRPFKAAQLATLPLIEAQQRFDALIRDQVQLLTREDTITLQHDDDQPPAPRLARTQRRPLNPRRPKDTSEGSGGQEG
ncbi:MAG: type IV secretory system conjugative DNA transfer family protein [Candidatus Binatia bacterium]|jgi:hypothetical protein